MWIDTASHAAQVIQFLIFGDLTSVQNVTDAVGQMIFAAKPHGGIAKAAGRANPQPATRIWFGVRFLKQPLQIGFHADVFDAIAVASWYSNIALLNEYPANVPRSVMPR